MTEFHAVAKVGSIAEGTAISARVGSWPVAIFRYEGKYFAVEDRCPHQGIPLAHGWARNGAIVCPRHTWRFRIEDGSWLGYGERDVALRVFPVRIDGDRILVGSEPMPVARRNTT